MPLLLAAPILIAVWALAGFYASLGPQLIRGMLSSQSPLLGGMALFVLAASGGVAVLLLQNRTPQEMMLLGAGSLLAGVALTVAALPNAIYSLFLPGTVVALLAQEGATLEKGAPILTLEVMKMEQTLRAPFAGVLKVIKCKVGDIVQEGVELAEVEPIAA